ncbi:MAG: hypothetical protein ACYTHK_08685 [Planctomycetota bacterium]|jgi:hypothetical protein
MGTFHSDKGELHGMTVVVDTHGPVVYVGRCDVETEDGIALLDADQHEAGEVTKEQYLAKAQKFGVFAKHRTLFVRRAEIASIRKLGEI